MVASLMAKQTEGGGKGGRKPRDGAQKGGTDKPKPSGVKLLPDEVQLVNLIATHRKLSVADLFREPDVQAFFRNLLLVEQQKLTARLEGGGRT